MEAQGRTDLTQQLESNPLYASIEVKLDRPDGAQGRGRRARPEEQPIVRNVINIEDLVDRLLTVTNILRTAGTVLLIVGRADRACSSSSTRSAWRWSPGPRRSRSCGSSARRTRSSAGRSCSRARSSGSSAPLVDAGHPGRRGRAAQRVHGRVLPGPAAPGRLADARPRHAGDGRGRRARDPRLVGVGPDLPHPLGPPGRRPYFDPVPFRCTLRAPRRPVTAPSRGNPIPPCSPRSTIIPIGSGDPSRRSIARRPAASRAARPAPFPIVPVAIALVALLAGSALFMSGYSMGRQSAVEPGTPASEDEAFRPFWDTYHTISDRYAGGDGRPRRRSSRAPSAG